MPDAIDRSRHHQSSLFRVLLKPQLIFRYFRSKDTPLLPKLGLLFAIAYFFFPFDLIPDAIPLIGWLDDLGVIGISLAWLGGSIARFGERQALLEETLR